jgi:hypothetical protein
VGTPTATRSSSGKNLPLLDANNGGSGRDIGDTLLKAANSIRNVDRVIPGHNPVMTLADLREYAQFNKDFLAAVQAGLPGGAAGQQDRRRNRRRLEARRSQVPGLHHRRGPPEVERPGHRRRIEVTPRRRAAGAPESRPAGVRSQATGRM